MSDCRFCKYYKVTTSGTTIHIECTHPYSMRFLKMSAQICPAFHPNCPLNLEK